MIRTYMSGKLKNKVIQITKNSTYPKTRALKVTKHERIQLNKKNCDCGKDIKLFPEKYFSNLQIQ